MTAPPSAPARCEARVLLVEDDARDAALVAELLDDGAPGDPVTLARVRRLSEARAALARSRHDVVLLDLSLPDATGLEAVEALCAEYPDVPVVVTTGIADDALATRAVHAGAQDYLVKGAEGVQGIRRAIRYAIERHAVARERAGLLRREREARAAAEAMAIENARLYGEARRAVEMRDHVLGVVSHDLRNPLSAVSMAASGLRSHADREVADLGETIGRSAAWALRTIRDLLDVTAIEAGRLPVHPEPMTVTAILEQTAAMFAALARERGVALTFEREPAARWVDADVDRLVQALGNLVGNALKFTPRGGRVAVSVVRDGEAVRFRVADSGPGIAPEDVPNLFDRFWQARRTRRDGVGLGLAIAKGIAEGHGGRVEVESALGAGSTFAIVLPDASSPAP